ncbi:hypothetical protein EJ110_NYTH20740 [Nymphaea thermarum]|nr:hypothetical protein EJ110_NYTH20740 [Nymphaea thermarum]
MNLVEEEGDDTPEETSSELGQGDEELADSLEISLHALSGHEVPQLCALRVGFEVERALGCTIDHQLAFDVVVGDGSTLKCKGKCTNEKLEIQGHGFSVQLYTLAMAGADLVLGIHWLKGLGEVVWDFVNMKLHFTQLDERRLTLSATLRPPVQETAVSKMLQGQAASLNDQVKENTSREPYVFNHKNMARRALKNTALVYLASLNDPELTELAQQEYKNATNMTEQFAALAALAQNPGDVRDEALSDFYKKWEHDFLVVNKWLALQAVSDIPGNVKNVQKLLDHPAFDLRNPNKVYSLIGGFCGSPVNFHAKDGSGYEFLGDIVTQLDKLNPQVASRMVSAFSRWKRYDKDRQTLAKAQLEKIVCANGLSENVYEIASKSLAA